MAITTTITCDGCKEVILPSSGYLRVTTEAAGPYQGDVPRMLTFCNSTCISEYKPAGAQ